MCSPEIRRLTQNNLSIASEERTLQLETPIGKTLRNTVILLIIFLFIGELVARQKSFQSLFIAPGIGSPHRQFEKQLGRLKRIVENEGEIDCIFIGSSTVLEGFNPLQFNAAIQAQIGKDFSCFNFGVDGLTAAGAGTVAQVLVENYHPQLLIYGTDPRDYTYPIEAEENTIIVDNPWIRYQLGRTNLLGWIFEHSYLMQYQEPLREVLHLQFYYEMRRYQDYTDEAKWGYLEISTERVAVSKPPSEYPDSNYVKVYSEILSDFQIFPENLTGLEQVISQQNNGVQVLVVEMPVAPGYADFFVHGYKDYEAYINKIGEYLKIGQVPFLRPLANISIPINSWTDYNHLNPRGTRLFSEWLGTVVGDIYIEEKASNLIP